MKNEIEICIFKLFEYKRYTSEINSKLSQNIFNNENE